jgi:hypothetical protein
MHFKIAVYICEFVMAPQSTLKKGAPPNTANKDIIVWFSIDGLTTVFLAEEGTRNVVLMSLIKNWRK